MDPYDKISQLRKKIAENYLVKIGRSKLVALEFVVSVLGSKVAEEMVDKNGATNMFSSSFSHLENNLIEIVRYSSAHAHHSIERSRQIEQPTLTCEASHPHIWKLI